MNTGHTHVGINRKPRLPSLIFSYPEIVAVAPLIGFEELLLRGRLCHWECDEVDLRSDGIENEDHIKRERIKHHRNSNLKLP